MKKTKIQEPKPITAEEFDRKFDAGEDITPWLDIKNARFSNPLQRVNVDFPLELIRKVDRESDRIGVTRTALIKMWVAERIDKIFPPRPPAAPAA